ncbi:MAG: sphingosine kinase [Alphaproteobacteria bacterium]|nr:sphingosine kinase [Alphaproteobacteria bacterium]
MGTRPTKVACIINGASGSNRAQDMDERLRELFANSGVVARITLASGSDLSALAEQAVRDEHTIVVAGGGDGTINAVASALVGTDVALGVLPLGTLNHFAKDLKIPLELEQAVANVFSGERVSVDVGEVNGRVFLNNSSIGVYPWFVQQRDDLQSRGYGKWMASLPAMLAVAKRRSRLYVRLLVDERHERARETPFAFVGNNKYEIAGVRLGERTQLDSGQLWVCRAPRVGLMKLPGLLLKSLAGFEPRELDTLETREVWIETPSKRVSVAIDGEVTELDSPLHYVNRPRALNVIVPVRDAAASKP